MSTLLEDLGYTRATEEEKEFYLKFINPNLKELAKEFNVPLKEVAIFINTETHRFYVGRERR